MILSAVVLAILAAGRGTAQPEGVLREPPFPLHHPALEEGRAEVLLYVSSSCPWCARELASWAGQVDPARHRSPVVVLSPDSKEGLDFVPPALRSRVVRDSLGALAQELGVQAVPILALVNEGGTVVLMSAGLSPQGQRDALLAKLETATSSSRRTPDDD